MQSHELETHTRFRLRKAPLRAEDLGIMASVDIENATASAVPRSML